MATPAELKNIQDELKWISVKEETKLRKKMTSKGIFGILVPLGCAVTAGVLATGMYHLYRSNSAKQQRFMRYRVVAQGVTIALAMFSLIQFSPSN